MQLADDPGSIDKSKYTEQLLALGRNSGLHQVGVASAEVLHRARQALNERKSQGLHNQMQFTYRNPNRSTDPTAALPSAKSVIVGALSYSTQMPEQPEKLSARVARYVWSDYYAQLRESLRQIAKQLESDGFRAVVLADDNAIVDREVAYQAGLGWFGKNSNLLIAGAGSYFVLGCVVTNAPLVVAEKPVEDGCGSCRRCLDNCPTQAIIAPGVIDANKCLAWLLQKPGVFDRDFRVALGDRLYGCDDCQEVCPPTVRFEKRTSVIADEPVKHDDRANAWVSVQKILLADDESLLKEFGAWYIANRDPKWLRRNALVILGNIGDADDKLVVELLQKYCNHGDAILRSHAVWAAARLGLNHLLPVSEDDEIVLAELRALPSVK
ncbi:MAG: tRNA epoxyqueuosine(34) reductase QueG [Ilumatobacteraceae bacterium]|nr:tRNA epoxyqueuosine(34) reductase QueG [Ilumatobacteraceae bacterium]